ncbi:hypothetical protein FBU30_000439 [Linnemannia zychae]|nr:hypothetical protein FBU30_000439 [Linnemannia zychae]
MILSRISSTRSHVSADFCRAVTSKQQSSTFFRSLSTSNPSPARLPYFHKQLKKKEASEAGTKPHTLIETTTTSASPQAAPSRKTTTSGSPDESAELSKRQMFKSITPSAQLMHEIRVQGLGSKAETWSFDKSRRGNKTIRPWDKKLSEEEWKKLQKERRLPSKHVWFEQRTSKVVEKEEVKFPSMRFVAGAAASKSVPTEEVLLKLVRPYYFEDLAEIEKSLAEVEEDQMTSVRLTVTPDEIQKLKERRQAKLHQIKDSKLPEVAIVGRSNVGKSTMLNTLTESPNTARVSNKPGLTRQLNFYRCGDKFVVVDMPGYGFAFAKEEDKAAWKELIENYIGTRKSLKRIYLMIDARHGLKVADKEFLTAMGAISSKKFQVVLTKCDLVTPPDLARTYMVVQEELRKSFRNTIPGRILMVSSYTGAGMNTLRKDMLHVCGQNILVRDRERPKSTLR